METGFFEEQTFERINFTKKPLYKGVYANCTFRSCEFSCAVLEGLRFVTFTDSRLKGARFSFPGILGLLEKYQIVYEPGA